MILSTSHIRLLTAVLAATVFAHQAAAEPATTQAAVDARNEREQWRGPTENGETLVGMYSFGGGRNYHIDAERRNMDGTVERKRLWSMYVSPFTSVVEQHRIIAAKRFGPLLVVVIAGEVIWAQARAVMLYPGGGQGVVPSPAISDANPGDVDEEIGGAVQSVEIDVVDGILTLRVTTQQGVYEVRPKMTPKGLTWDVPPEAQ